MPQRVFTHGQADQGPRHIYAARTRFISPELLGLFERTSWPPAAPEAGRQGGQGQRVDLAARMRGMWR